MTLLEIMNRACFVRKGSKMVFVCDLSNLDRDSALKVIERGKDIIKRMPKKSVLAVACLVNLEIDREMELEIKQLIVESDPYVYRGAVSGLKDSELKLGFGSFMTKLGEQRSSFDCFEDALTWLLESEHP